MAQTSFVLSDAEIVRHAAADAREAAAAGDLFATAEEQEQLSAWEKQMLDDALASAFA